jgi:hypothetical protein
MISGKSYIDYDTSLLSYHHRPRKIGQPIFSALDKPQVDKLAVEWPPANICYSIFLISVPSLFCFRDKAMFNS